MEEGHKPVAQPQRRLNPKWKGINHFDGTCMQAFELLKKRMTEASILIAPNWELPFDLMCDASDIAVEAEKREALPFHLLCKQDP